MGRQTVAGHINHAFARCYARRNHPPANSTLRTTEDAQQQQTWCPAGWDLATQQEPEETNCPHQANNAAQLTMAPLPPVNHFKVRELHPLVLNAKLINGLILRKFGLPISGIQRWNRASKRAPFCNAKATVSEAGKPTNQYHQHNQSK